jgi:hypothetical protein
MRLSLWRVIFIYNRHEKCTEDPQWSHQVSRWKSGGQAQHHG